MARLALAAQCQDDDGVDLGDEAVQRGGHDFTQSLTDEERWALLEYLKTL